MIAPTFGLALDNQVTSTKGLADCYGSWEGIRSNHVISSSGDFFGPDGSSRSISTAADRDLLIALRAKADLIVVDAATARAEKYKLPSAGAAVAIFSASGDFGGIPAVEESSGQCILFSPETPVVPNNARYEPLLSRDNPLEGIAPWAKEQGLPAVLLEAGPTLTRLAFRSGAVDNSALTISGENLDAQSVVNLHPFDPVAKLLSIAYAQGACFTYWSH